MKKLLLTLTCLVLLATPVLGVFRGSASALSGSSFQAGNIISDSVFYAGNSLNSSQIQSFLNSKMPTCDTNGTKPSGHSGYPTRADWGRHNGYPPPYICLKSYTQNTPAIAAESGICGNLSARTGRSAALIIADVASACGVSPKALIVLLQKEQGLVTDEWPWPSQYRSATGYGCPDTAPCNAEYYGFFNQVYKAAWQFKKYRANPDNYNFVAGQNNNIRWSPNASCGSRSVFILNQATAGLYNYTPYQPNAAALNNLYGTGDSCSAYGNRNFWRYFNDWFGTTWSTPFFRIGNTDAVYVLGSNNNYYHVPSPSVLYDYGYKRVFPNIIVASSSYMAGKTNSGELPNFARFGGDAIYQLNSGKTHHYTSAAQFNHFGHSIGGEALLPSWIYEELVQSTDMQQVVKQSSAPEVYYVQNGKKSHIINNDAFTTMGSPTYSSQASVTLSSASALSLPDGAPIMPTNTLVRSLDTNAYGFWNGSSLQAINTVTAQSTGLGPDYEALAAVLNQLPPSGNPAIGSLAKNSSGTLYLLDHGVKFTVASGQLSDLGLTGTDFVLAPDDYLGRYTTTAMSTLIRINGGDPIYLIQGGKLYHIYSGADFSGLGYNPTNVLSVNPSTSSLFANSGLQLFAQGKLVRVGGQPQIYLINGSFTKQWISSSQMFNNFGFSLKHVVSVPATALNGYTSGPALTQINKDSLGTFWLIDSGVRRKISTTLLGSTYYNINQAGTPTLATQILNSVTTGSDLTDYIRANGQSQVYAVKNGQKCWFTSRASFFAHGGSWDQVSNLSPSYVASLPTGPPIN